MQKNKENNNVSVAFDLNSERYHTFKKMRVSYGCLIGLTNFNTFRITGM